MSVIVGDLHVSSTWVVFSHSREHDFQGTHSEQSAAAKARFEVSRGWAPTPEQLSAIPERLVWQEQEIEPRRYQTVNHQLDLHPILGAPPFGAAGVHLRDFACWGQAAWVYVPVTSPRAEDATLGFGGDWVSQVWFNGEQVYASEDAGECAYPPSCFDQLVTVQAKQGENLLAVLFISGKVSPVLAIGGPEELRMGRLNSILTDPFLYGDSTWSDPDMVATPGNKEVVSLGSRRELFVDDFLIDSQTGCAELRLHHPQPREIVWQREKPWENAVCAFFTAMQVEDKIRLTYSARPDDQTIPQAVAIAESTDGIHFSRPVVGEELEFWDAKETNIVLLNGKAGHNFAPFRDQNPAAPADQRYKAIAYHPACRALAAYGSADGLHWRMLQPAPIITKGAFDSQNIAFWDELRGCYVCYYRACEARGDRRAVLGIMTCTSTDFLTWSEAEFLEYDDARQENLYINCIRPYARAPHLYIGTPARFVHYRTKLPGRVPPGISDAILMTSRDGRRFHRWEEAFLRPGQDPEVWTDRNNFPAWGMIQTSPGELSMYWTEHYRHDSLRLRRGVLRTDGFASLHAGAGLGEILTRPMLMSGKALEVNVATSAIGAVRIGICDESGAPFAGFSLEESEVLFGNELAHRVRWNGRGDVSSLAGRPLRLRIRLHDADLFSFCFSQT